MSRQYRKLQEKLYQKPSEKKPAEKKIGRDYVLMAVTVFTVLVTAAGWMQLDNVSRGMYSLLSVSLILTYARRHANLSEKAAVLVERGSLVTMVLAVLLFLATLFVHFTS
ncbi:hypothetical protein HF878_04560 [Selenomonas bovis]|uniref:Uncharacterized protein n=1 Tax=Selenomonas bovis TaxID=416586 RepID=A0A848B6E1_9FIRM|nr:hypothetical protein [Selenomonas bovis]MCI7056059.1 hypothetical protein [Selenomonas bovis]NMD98758.1 hypothetical protein [Selenomonas bovis]